MDDFILEFEKFSKKIKLSEIKKSLINWKRVFEEILIYVRESKKPTVLIFDEIQWIASAGSGFLGRLKEAWIDLERAQKKSQWGQICY